MISILRGHDAAVAEWMAERLPHPATPPAEVVTFAVVERDKMLGAAAFTDYRPDVQGIEISVVTETPRAVTRAVIRAVFSYPFIQLGCRWVSMHTPLGNRAMKLARGVGFVQRGIEPDYYAPGAHRVLLTMPAKAWPALLQRL